MGLLLVGSTQIGANPFNTKSVRPGNQNPIDSNQTLTRLICYSLCIKITLFYLFSNIFFILVKQKINRRNLLQTTLPKLYTLQYTPIIKMQSWKLSITDHKHSIKSK